MTYHILNGDALINTFTATGLGGEVIVMRECLVEGDLTGNTAPAFYGSRANYLSETYGANKEDYYTRVVSQFEKLNAAPDHSEFNLWFGYDLFCRANMWYLLSLLHYSPIEKQVFVVYPSYMQGNDIWKEYGPATPEDLIACFKNRILLNNADLQLGDALWAAFKNGDLIGLEQLSKQHSNAFPYLEEVCKAHIERFPKQGEKGRPERVIEEVVEGIASDFSSVYVEFFKREGIYGFGDSQVKQLYDKVMLNR
jgi:hypothetical protein